MTSDLREMRLALPVYRPVKWLVHTLVCQPDRHGLNQQGLRRRADAIDDAAKRLADHRFAGRAARHRRYRNCMPDTLALGRTAVAPLLSP